MATELTPAQRSAVETISGDLAISAGAGSGKTTVLARRFAQGLRSEAGADWSPAGMDQVLTITFTAKAAGEIAERVRRVVNEEISPEVGRRVDEVWISTIHTLCSRLVRRHALECGVDPDFAQADELESAMLMAEAFESAAARLHAGDEDVAGVFREYPFEAVRTGVLALHDNIRAMGLDPRDMVAPTGEEMLGATVGNVIRCAERLARLSADCDSAAASRNGVCAADYAVSLSRCVCGEEVDFGRLEEILAAFQTKKVGDDRAKEAVDCLRLANAELGLILLGMKERGLLRGFEKLVREFAVAYVAVKGSRGFLDFDDLQEHAAQLFERHPRIAHRYREHFRMIMVDEFQDTNDLQMRVLGHLRNHNFCVVGDERQSIYGFRYADVGIFEKVRRQIENKSELRDNFRSHPDVLSFVNEAFSGSELFGSSFMRLSAGREPGEPDPALAGGSRIRCILVDTAECEKIDLGRESEAESIAAEVARLVSAGTRPQDIAILLRNATNASLYASAIEARGLPVWVSAGRGFFDTREVEEALALLRVIALPFDDDALLSVLASRLVSVSDDALLALRTTAGPRGRLYDALRTHVLSAEHGGWLWGEDREALSHAYRAVEALRTAQTGMQLGELVTYACEAFDYDLALFSAGAEGVRAWANIEKLARFAEAFEAAESSDVGAFVKSMQLRSREASRESTATVETGAQSVRIMTIHSSKGLEFPVVFVADLGVQTVRSAKTFLVGAREVGGVRRPVVGVKLPDGTGKVKGTLEHRRLAEQSRESEIEEQKRCLYVACTRAREMLVLSGASNLSKEPSGEHMIDWVRMVLGDIGQSGAANVGSVEVDVEVVAPPAVEMPAGTNSEEGAEARSGVGQARVSHAAIDLPQRLRDESVRRRRTVSYTALHQFETCPYSFYVRSVLGLKEPTGLSGPSATRFGSAVHEVLQTADPSGPEPDALAAAIRRHRFDGAEADRLAATVGAFLGSPLAERAFAGERVDREQPLRVSLGEMDLVGNVDLISWQGSSALVVDYKTGKAPDEASERLAGYRLQASCYALAALRDGAAEVEVIFAFVEHEGRTLSFCFDLQSAEGIEGDLKERIAVLAEGVYPHRESFSAEACLGCLALGGLCPVDDPRLTTSGRY